MTPAELQAAVLRKLGVLAATESPSAEDAEVVRQHYESLHEQLIQEGLADWGASQTVPEWADRIMVKMVAAACADEFGVDEARLQRLLLEGGWNMTPVSQGEKQLRRQMAIRYVPKPVDATYY